MTALHPLVADLVRLVSRLFYRDEYVVVMDAMIAGPLRDDALETTFHLPHTQVRAILTRLVAEKMVCVQKITQKRPKLARGELDIDKLLKGARQPVRSGSKRRRDVVADESTSSEDSDASDSSDDAPNASTGSRGRGVGRGMSRNGRGVRPVSGPPRVKKRVSARMYFINPRYIVDAVRFRLLALRRSLERLETVAGGDAQFRCTACGRETGALEATSRSRAVTVAVETARDARSRGLSVPPVAAATLLAAGATGDTLDDFISRHVDGATLRCPSCNGRIVGKPVDRIATVAGATLRRFADTCSATGLTPLLARLEHVALGGGWPRNMLAEGLLTLLPATGEGRLEPQGGPRPAGNLNPSATVASTVNVAFVDETVAAAAPVVSVGRASSAAVRVVSSASLPFHLQRSAVTGNASAAIGFLHIAHNAQRRTAEPEPEAAVAAPPVTAEAVLSSLLSSAGQGDGNGQREDELEVDDVSNEELWAALLAHAAAADAPPAAGEEVQAEVTEQAGDGHVSSAAAAMADDEWEDV